MRGEEAYWNSCALLAIHSAVSYSDALRAGLGDDHLSADDHQKAAESLRRLLPANGMQDQTGLQHLQHLTSKKSRVAYGDQRLTGNDYQLLVTKAERFAKWANNMGSLLKIEGWQNDD